MKYAHDYITNRGAAEVRSCVLLDKPARREVEVKADYVGFTIDDVFVVGYGLDYNGRYRDLPYLGVLEEESIVK
jgi:hypoxanthine phosphoribosyltransferase